MSLRDVERALDSPDHHTVLTITWAPDVELAAAPTLERIHAFVTELRSIAPATTTVTITLGIRLERRR